MGARRKIALLTMEFSGTYPQRVLEGVFSQCEKFGYDVAVISTMIEPTHHFEENLKGEINIFQLVNFDQFDGVIIAPLPLLNDENSDITLELENLLHEKCHCRVISVDLAFGGYETVITDDSNAFYEITKHLFEEHGRRKIYFLSGQEEHEVSRQRESGYRRFFEEKGIAVPDSYLFFGDYWYPSGEKLAEDIVSGRVEMPDAVICGNDYMAIGLANRLKLHGIQVPEQVAVTGFDATFDASFNDVVITSYEPEISNTTALAVKMLHDELDPDDYGNAGTEAGVGHYGGLRIGESCGCEVDMDYWKKRINKSLVHRKKNDNDVNDENSDDVTFLLDTYMSEKLMNAKGVDACMEEIFRDAHLLDPYGEVWLCLKENWLDLTDVRVKGYPERMRVFAHAVCGESRQGEAGMVYGEERYSFDVNRMLPDFEEGDRPNSIYYFLPVHATDEVYGYVVYRNDMSQKNRPGYMLCNWIRIVTNALSMTRIKNQLMEYSVKDSATGLFNRRGLAQWVKNRNLSDDTDIMVIMADMDGLKYINDHFGHAEGDFSLNVVAMALKEAGGNNELAVRTGGDEFLLVGVGRYDEESVREKIEKINGLIHEKSKASCKAYGISASIGFALGRLATVGDAPGEGASDQRTKKLDELIEAADIDMYCNKRKRNAIR